VGACNSTTFLSRRFQRPIYFKIEFPWNETPVHGSAMTNHKKVIDVTASLDGNRLSFTKEKVY